MRRVEAAECSAGAVTWESEAEAEWRFMKGVVQGNGDARELEGPLTYRSSQD